MFTINIVNGNPAVRNKSGSYPIPNGIIPSGPGSMNIKITSFNLYYCLLSNRYWVCYGKNEWFPVFLRKGRHFWLFRVKVFPMASVWFARSLLNYRFLEIYFGNPSCHIMASLQKTGFDRTKIVVLLCRNSVLVFWETF